MQLSAEVPIGFGRYLEKIAREIWERKALERGYDPVLIRAYGERLGEAVKTGYGKDYVEMDFSTPDYRKLHRLEKNVWQFSSAKTYTHLRQMSDALRRPDGTLRTFDEFRIQVASITGGQLRHLKTEYQTAVAGAQMAAMWQRIQELKHIYPLLQFIAVEDDHTTELCKRLDGIILPVDHPFWLTYFPINHYGCRSTVKQLRKGTVTPDDQLVYPDIPSIFRVNLGERGLAFPEDHAYFEGTPPEVIEASRQFYPYNMQMEILDVSDGLQGIVRQHYMVGTDAPDYDRNYGIAVSRAREQKILVDLMPTLDPDTRAAQRAIVFPDGKPRVSPDLRIDKVLWEEEGLHATPTKKNISNAVGRGAKQANHVMVSILNGSFDRKVLGDIAKGRFNTHRDLKVIEFRFSDGTTVTFEKGKS